RESEPRGGGRILVGCAVWLQLVGRLLTRREPARIITRVRLAVVAVILWAFSMPAAAWAAEPRSVSIGTSQGGQPLLVYELGSGAQRVLILGGQHGGPERNTVELTQAVLDYFTTNPEDLPASISLDIMPVANPDGVAAGSRQFLDGVDPNRNWGGNDWRAEPDDSNPPVPRGTGGRRPLS